MISRNYRIRVRHSDNTTWFLQLENVNLTDRGNYMCQINTVPPISKQGYLEVVGEYGARKEGIEGLPRERWKEGWKGGCRR